jgi:hypothetical protein
MQAFGVVRDRDILRLMTAYVVALRNMPVCDSSTGRVLYGWMGGKDLVYWSVVVLYSTFRKVK